MFFQRKCLKKERQAFRCCLNKDMEMWDESSSWRFSNTRTEAACFFCCWKSEKLFPVISHLVTSRTNILLLLGTSCCFFSLYRQMVQELLIINSPLQPSSIEVCFCGTFIKWSYAPVTLFILLPELGRKQRGSGRAFCCVMYCGNALQKLISTGPSVLLDFLLQKGEDVGRVNLVPLLP